MNCKPGDLAVIVRSHSGLNLGKIVTCLERYDGPWLEGDHEPGWLLDRPLASGQLHIADYAVRPIRDQPGTDEMIRIAGLTAPHLETV